MQQNRIVHLFPPEPQSEDSPEPTTALEHQQEVLRHYVRMLAEGHSHGLFVFGPGGNGKSTVVSETLTEAGSNLATLNSHITALGLFQALWAYRSDHVLLVEDCEHSFSSPAILGLFRSALCGVGDKRIVTYTTSKDLGFPPSFEFRSRIVFCANDIPRTPAFKAMVSRCLVYQLEPSNDDIIEQFRKESEKGFRHSNGVELSAETCHGIVDFIACNANRRLCMRLLKPIFQTVAYAIEAGTAWRPLVENQLNELVSSPNVPKATSKKDELAIAREALAKHPDSTKDQVRHFTERSGRSRATFFRLKKQLNEKE